MDIRDLARRHHTHAAHSSKPAAETSATESTESAAPAASTETQSASATTHRLSGGGRFMHFLQAFEDKHPEETKRMLNGIADKLRSDAEHAGPWSARLERWADKLEKAAESGDMSNLMPSLHPHAHFGMRAYQKAQETPDAGELEHVAAAVESSIPPMSGTSASAQPAAPVNTDAAADSSNAQPSTTASATSTDAAPSGSAGVTTPIISGSPAADSPSSSAQANTPIIPGTPSATDGSRMSA